MLDRDANANKMVETTDCLETVSVFKAGKNFFFVVTMIALLCAQAVFWLGDFGLISWQSGGEPESVGVKSVQSNDLASMAEVGLKLVQEPAEDDSIIEDAKKAVKEVVIAAEDTKNQVEETGDKAVLTDNGAREQINVVEDGSSAEKAYVHEFTWKADWDYVRPVLRLINSVMIFSVTFYCLILLFSLKVSLMGRLGGMAHISMAFLISIFAALFILPWQLAFPGVLLAGAIYTPTELAEWITKVSDNGILTSICYYLRFELSFFLSFILLSWAQLRSRKWSKATLRRLGILQ